jgi:hypothetical protein
MAGVGVSANEGPWDRLPASISAKAYRLLIPRLRRL